MTDDERTTEKLIDMAKDEDQPLQVRFAAAQAALHYLLKPAADPLNPSPADTAKIDEWAAQVQPRPEPIRVALLTEGANLTNGDRDADYGPPAVNMAAAGELKAVFRKHLRRDISQAELEAIDMALTKLGRLATGKPKRDTYVDAATYLAIAGEIGLTAT